MPYDVAAIKERTDLLALTGRDTILKKVASTNGGEWCGPCPFCRAGRDRFHVWPEHEGGGRWWCRVCGAGGDAIGYVRARDGLGFRAACEALAPGREVQKQTGFYRSGGQGRPTKVNASQRSGPPSPSWQDRARAFAAYAQRGLWGDDEALAYLRGRGLAADTIRGAGLGYNPRQIRDAPERWGLAGGHVTLPVGWVIPCEMGGELWYVKVRRPEGDPRYQCLRGSAKRGAIYGLDALGECWDAILAEGELNALTLRQELAGVVGVVSVGDAGNVPGTAALSALARVPRWWALYDPDKAGQDGSDKLAGISARVRAISWFYGCDANEAHQQGHDLAAAILPQVGPSDPGKRAAWLSHWLDALDGAAFEAGTDDKAPALRAWRALYADQGKLVKVGVSEGG